MNPLLRFFIWCFYHRPIDEIRNCARLGLSDDLRMTHPNRDDALRFLEQWGKR